jgi:glutamine synthetase
MDGSLASWVEQNGHVRDLYVGLSDIHGILRGKRIPFEKLRKLDRSPIRMPISATAVDIWGNDVLENPLFLQSGDRDGLCLPTGRLPIDIFPGRTEPLPLLPLWLADENGEPHEADPRGALARAKQRCMSAGLTPVVGTELEFYLLNPQSSDLAPATFPHSGKAFSGGGVLSLDKLQAIQPFLDEVYRTSEANGVKPDASVTEGGPGQFEIAIAHSDDVMKAADDFLILKYIVRHVARKHGFDACFMAKPFPDLSGCGFHVHLSLLDKDGTNVFSSGAPNENSLLRVAVGGLLDALCPSTLVFAPHLNSYRRFAETSLAPTTVSWGIENRTSAIRIPDGSAEARRIEHRVSGADANPYLVLTVILNAVLDGIERNADPGPPIQESSYSSGSARIPGSWVDAMKAFGEGGSAHGLLPPLLSRSFALCKSQELSVFSAQMTDFEIETYKGTV